MSTEDNAMAEFLSSFGIDPNTTAAGTQTETPPNTDPPPDTGTQTQTPPETPPDTQTQTPDTDTQTQQQTPPPDDSATKSAQAFAKMRVENSKMNNMLKSVATILGVENLGDQDALQKALEQKITEAEAKKQNIPPEILTRLKQVEEQNATYAKEQLERTAYLGFQKVKDTYSLDNTQLQAFARQLSAAGKDPFSTPIDLVSEYKLQNFDTLVAKAVADAVRAEQERAAKAAQQSSTPNNTNGVSGGDPEKINTVKGLDEFFNKLK